jgi:hypothetical protein
MRVGMLSACGLQNRGTKQNTRVAIWCAKGITSLHMYQGMSRDDRMTYGMCE